MLRSYIYEQIDFARDNGYVSTILATSKFWELKVYGSDGIVRIINEKDLIKALDEETIAGVGLDVYETEPLPQDHKLRFFPQALLFPHIGYVTAENYSKFYFQMMENLNACLKNKPIRTLE